MEKLLQQIVKTQTGLAASQAAADVRVTLAQEQGSKSLEKAMVHYGDQLVKVANDANNKISAVREDVSVVRQDVTVVREDVSVVRVDVCKLQEQVKKMVSDRIFER